MEKPKKDGILERTAELFDLPGDIVAGMPRVVLTGNREFRMENHKGILAYGSEEIHINGGKMIWKVQGTDLELKAMNANELFIMGRILGIQIE
ncbi:MAG: sporulation protein [Oscillospiraceae bacterium]|nr:sporulation protein [Oscillospiraceae bacterium]